MVPLLNKLDASLATTRAVLAEADFIAEILEVDAVLEAIVLVGKVGGGNAAG